MPVESWLRLALAPEVGPVLGHRLLAAFGSPEAIFAASERELTSVSGLGPGRAARLMDGAVQHIAGDEAHRAREAGVRLVTLEDEEYPRLLRRLEYSPLVLWVRGRIEPVDRLAVALVGPRSPSPYARLMVDVLVPALAAHGLTVVSGLAHGIDAEAHSATVQAGGRTLAVLGQGLGTPIYPQANAELAERIAAEGCGAIISVFPMNAEPSPGLFPQRNEIIAGLCLGTLVIEASATSGSLITARHAAASGRVVMACPADATRRAAQGSNRLIADGAFLIQSAQDVLAALAQELRRERDELGISDEAGGRGDRRDGNEEAGNADQSRGPGQTESGDGAGKKGAASPARADLTAISVNPVTRAIIALLESEPLPVDAIVEHCLTQGHSHSAVLERLLMLEIDGFLRQMPGRLYALAPSADPRRGR